MNVLQYIVFSMCVALVVLSPTLAHCFAENTCTPPKVPEKIETIWELDSFIEKAYVYRRCIEKYVESVKEAAAEQDSLFDDSVYYQQKAIDAFNTFSDAAIERINSSDIPFIDAMD